MSDDNEVRAIDRQEADSEHVSLDDLLGFEDGSDKGAAKEERDSS